MSIISIFLLLVQGETMIKLPVPQFTNRSIEACIEARRSIRDFKNDSLTIQEISNILWAAQGITDKTHGFRSSPSAGATYPLELFVAKHDGLFRYIPQSHALKKQSDSDVRKDIAQAALNQMFIADAGLVIVITAVFERTTYRYGKRGIQYVYNEVGHCAQNVLLEAVALGLGSVPIGAFDDAKLSQCCDLQEEEPLYILPVGYPK
jgi:SagB-type dehydrogenase family enzyme